MILKSSSRPSICNIQDLVPCQSEGYNGRLCRRQDCGSLALIIVIPNVIMPMYREDFHDTRRKKDSKLKEYG